MGRANALPTFMRWDGLREVRQSEPSGKRRLALNVIIPLQSRKAASGDLSGRDFGAGREESPEGCARGRKGEMPERRVFKLTAGSKGKGTGIPAVYQSCSARVERLLRDGRVDACRFDGFHNKGGAC